MPPAGAELDVSNLTPTQFEEIVHGIFSNDNACKELFRKLLGNPQFAEKIADLAKTKSVIQSLLSSSAFIADFVQSDDFAKAIVDKGLLRRLVCKPEITAAIAKDPAIIKAVTDAPAFKDAISQIVLDSGKAIATSILTYMQASPSSDVTLAFSRTVSGGSEMSLDTTNTKDESPTGTLAPHRKESYNNFATVIALVGSPLEVKKISPILLRCNLFPRLGSNINVLALIYEFAWPNNDNRLEDPDKQRLHDLFRAFLFAPLRASPCDAVPNATWIERYRTGFNSILTGTNGAHDRFITGENAEADWEALFDYQFFSTINFDPNRFCMFVLRMVTIAFVHNFFLTVGGAGLSIINSDPVFVLAVLHHHFRRGSIELTTQNVTDDQKIQANIVSTVPQGSRLYKAMYAKSGVSEAPAAVTQFISVLFFPDQVGMDLLNALLADEHVQAAIQAWRQHSAPQPMTMPHDSSSLFLPARSREEHHQPSSTAPPPPVVVDLYSRNRNDRGGYGTTSTTPCDLCTHFKRKRANHPSNNCQLFYYEGTVNFQGQKHLIVATNPYKFDQKAYSEITQFRAVDSSTGYVTLQNGSPGPNQWICIPALK